MFIHTTNILINNNGGCVKSEIPEDRPFFFAGTKKKIFESSIMLFAKKGYENVSMIDIASMVDIRQSAVYNHFKSKQEILDTIYEFFYHYTISNRAGKKGLRSLLETGSAFDIVTKGFTYEYEAGVIEQMSDAAKIVMQRAATDKSAADLLKTLLLEEGIRYVEEGLDMGVEIGRFASFDTHTVAVLINCVRLNMHLWWLIGTPEDEYAKRLADEFAMYELITALIPDLKPPNR